MKKAIGIIILIAVLIGAIFYFGRHKTSPEPTSSSTSQSTSGSTSSVSADKISISGFAFSPKAVTVKVGTTITWTNADSTPHTVTSDDDSPVGGLASPQIANGKTFSFTFTTAGTYTYHCSIHPDMTGSVTVTQ